MGQHQSTIKELVTQFDKDVMKCTTKAVKSRPDLGTNATDDAYADCLQKAIDKHHAASAVTNVTSGGKKISMVHRGVKLGHH